jgi:hypothetical protein
VVEEFYLSCRKKIIYRGLLRAWPAENIWKEGGGINRRLIKVIL